MKGVKSNYKNNNASYNRKYQSHIPCSLTYKVVCIDDKFSKPVVLYKGKNAINKFIELILKEYKYRKKKNKIKKHFNKNLGMSEENEERFQSSKKCWIYNKSFDVGDNKVRDHNLITGKYVLLIGVVILILN